MSEKDNLRPNRTEINKPCLLDPWGVPAKVENMSLTGALIHCLDFTDELLTSTEGILVLEKMKLPGDFIRLDKYKIAIQFKNLDSHTQKLLSNYLSQFS